MAGAGREGGEVARLLAERARRHRLRPSRPLASAAEAEAFVAERGVVLTTGKGSLPSLPQAVVGREIRGSWMADREVHRIYRVLSDLLSRPVLQATLFGGKSCLLPAAAAPVLQRIAADAERRRGARSALSPAAARLLDEVETEGEARRDAVRGAEAEGRKARLELQRHLLVWPEEVHTDRGYHTVRLRPWSASPFDRRAAEADRLGYDEAVDRLVLAAVRAAVIVPRREARAWLPFGQGRLEALLAAGDLRALGPGASWVTTA
jgi:hypothetical protein